jgi:peptidoglycan/LPS O-acetylase OafA/YrhL
MRDRANNFDTLRFCAALAVLWAHAFPLAMGPETLLPLMTLSGGQTSLATVAVAIFFVISGYLITQSFVQSSSAWRFVKARILRIMPGLLIVLALLGLLVGPMATTLPLNEYFSSKDFYKFLILNGSLERFYSHLPGVFAENALPSVVDGPLWTLPIEARCYAAVFVLGILGILKRYTTLALFLCGLAYLVLDGPYFEDRFQQQNHLIDLGTKFLAGAVLYHWHPRLNGIVAIACAGLTMLALVFGGFWLVLPTFFSYVVIYVALGPMRLPNMARYGDLSYGIYIYGWPVMQLIVMYSLASTWYSLGIIATPIVMGLAFLSWHLVEKVALSHKNDMLPAERWLSAHLDHIPGTLRSGLSHFSGR